MMASKSAFFDHFYDRVGNFGRGHFRLEVVGGDFGRGDEHALLAGKWFFDAAVEKISYVRVFFGFGDAKIFKFESGENFGEDVLEFSGAFDEAKPGPGFVVLGHGRRRRDFWARAGSTKAENVGSARALVIWRARSARKLKIMTAS